VYGVFAIYQVAKVRQARSCEALGRAMSQFGTVATVHDTLERVFFLLDGWFERPAEELEARPDYPGAWTIAEHLEHVCLVNHFLLLTIRKHLTPAWERETNAGWDANRQI
jgi:hypothetical protein